jgi:hypothetical protein
MSYYPTYWQQSYELFIYPSSCDAEDWVATCKRQQQMAVLIVSHCMAATLSYKKQGRM